MCLTTKEKPEIKVAEEDIVCYKVVKVGRGLTLRTPYRGMKIELEREYTEPSFEKELTTKQFALGIIILNYSILCGLSVMISLAECSIA